MPTSSEAGLGRGRRIGATALVAATSAAAMLTLDGTASALTSTVLAQYEAPDKVVEGSSVTFRAKLSTSGGTELGYKYVELQRSFGGQYWKVTTRRTYSNGRVYAAIHVKNTASYRWVYRGSNTTAGDTSGVQRVIATNPINLKIVRAAAAQQGDPYVYGANGPDRFDCSGLTQYAHKLAGISLPRTSRDQYAGTRHVSKDSKRAGDLLFFFTGGRVTHAAIYAGSGYMWTAPQSGETVKKKKIYSSSYAVGRAW